MTEPTLFDLGAADHRAALPPKRRPANPESVEAMRSIDASAIDGRIVGYMRENFNAGFTCDEIEVALKLRHQTASSAVWRLKKAGVMVETADRRETRSGRMARVLVLSDNE